jgi:hypothetical protein
MKNIKMLLLIPVGIISFSSCGGDHPARNLGDTSKNSYHVPHDTTRADSTGADTNSTDNSGSGGTKIHKPDTAKKK